MSFRQSSSKILRKRTFRGNIAITALSFPPPPQINVEMVGNAKVTYPHVIYEQIKTRSHLKNTFTTLILGEGFFLCQNQKFSIYFEDDCLRHVAGVLIGMSVNF